MKIAIMGCGIMGSAFARHWAKEYSVILCDPNREMAETLAKEIGGTFHEKLEDAAREADVILLAVKPKDLPSVAGVIGPLLTPDHLLISILAGTSVATLKRYFPTGLIVRTMPNLGLTRHSGVIGIVNDEALSLEARKKVDMLLEGMGLKLGLSENKIEALTALSGSGIGFMFVIIEAMIDGGVHLGFTSTESTEIVLKTMEGAIALMRGSGKHPAELKLQISSPGGTTIAGLRAMEEAGVRSGIFRTLVACYDRALEMRKDFESG
jgi:pyrroline-5-carboxylate reductase